MPIEFERDPLSTARGICVGVLVSAALWALIIWALSRWL